MGEVLMLRKFFILFIFIFLVGGVFASSLGIMEIMDRDDQNEDRFIGGDLSEFILSEQYDFTNEKLKENYEKKGVLVRVISRDHGWDFEKHARESFSSSLTSEGIPTLNVLILYVHDMKKVGIIYSEDCGLDKGAMEEITSKITKKMNSIKDFGSQESIDELHVIFQEALDSIYGEIDRKLAKIPVCKRYGTEVPFEKETCKGLYPGEELSGDQRRILFLGMNFESENEFKDSLKNIVDTGFNRIQPFKKYTGEDMFNFVYGGHDLDMDYDDEGYLTEEYSNIADIRKTCSNVFQLMIIDKKFDESHDSMGGFYVEGMEIVVSSPISGTVIHETGHHFTLNDEYIYPEGRDRMKERTSCTENPSEWKDLLSDVTKDYSFNGCSLSNLYRSSENSIMQGSGSSLKFNFLSCMIIVSKMERKLLGDPEVKQVCVEMYENNELERNLLEMSGDCLEPLYIQENYEGSEIKLEEDLFFCDQGYSIKKSDFIFDCQGHILRSNNKFTGISIRGDNVHLKNCILENFNIGIYLDAEASRISNVDIRNNRNSLAILDVNAAEIELEGIKEEYYNKIILIRGEKQTRYNSFTEEDIKLTFTE
jgi:hypothetical protein